MITSAFHPTPNAPRLQITIRADASPLIGSGHVMRCLALSTALRRQGHEVRWLTSDHPQNLREKIVDAGFEIQELPHILTPFSTEGMFDGTPAWALDAENTRKALRQWPRPDWLVVDHYSLEEHWHRQIRASVEQIFVIDDLANRSHDADLLLDQNFHEQGPDRYRALVPPSCRLILGPEYALLREEFAAQAPRTRSSLKRLLVFYGSGDITGETLKALTALSSKYFSNILIDVVVGALNPHVTEIRHHIAQFPNWILHENTNSMAVLMAEADLALGAGGMTSWERAYLGLPTILTSVAENQLPLAEKLASHEAAFHLGWHNTVTPERLAGALMRFIEPGGALLLQRMSRQTQGFWASPNEIPPRFPMDRVLRAMLAARPPAS